MMNPNKSTFFVLFLAFFILHSVKSQSLGAFHSSVDIGTPKFAGNSYYDVEKQVYRIKGAGSQIGMNKDEFHFLCRNMKGDFMVTANFAFDDVTGRNSQSTLGWMVRESLATDAVHFTAAMQRDGLTMATWRELRGAYMRPQKDEFIFPKKKARTIQLERKGNAYTMRIANEGEPLQSFGAVTVDGIGKNPYVGLFVCSNNPDVPVEVHIWNVRVDKMVPPGFNFNGTDSLHSRLEILDVVTGNRQVIYESPVRFEAPNWMPDGKHLLFNSKGYLWTIPIDGKSLPSKLNTGNVNRNNNDHVISFDGKWLGISSHRSGLSGGGSTIYVLPLAGGEPQMVTEKTPSYLHGWAANNREVYYVGRRDTGQYALFHIFKANIKTGEETRLTQFTFGHVDGPEGSPDGKWVYFNGSMTGTMQLWRMEPDGTGLEQLTFDQYNNWFPHISPDGKWIAYIAFEPDIDPTQHPGCKQVSLKIMPVTGGAPKTIAYLYGGQGTINTPSWSPDSKYVAFVSYSDRDK
jgi:Tol biopolymer transport system component